MLVLCFERQEEKEMSKKTSVEIKASLVPAEADVEAEAKAGQQV